MKLYSATFLNKQQIYRHFPSNIKAVNSFLRYAIRTYTGISDISVKTDGKWEKISFNIKKENSDYVKSNIW